MFMDIEKYLYIIMGVDGSGKTTIVDKVTCEMEKLYQNMFVVKDPYFNNVEMKKSFRDGSIYERKDPNKDIHALRMDNHKVIGSFRNNCITISDRGFIDTSVYLNEDSETSRINIHNAIKDLRKIYDEIHIIYISTKHADIVEKIVKRDEQDEQDRMILNPYTYDKLSKSFIDKSKIASEQDGVYFHSLEHRLTQESLHDITGYILKMILHINQED